MPLRARIRGRHVHSFDLPHDLTWKQVQEASRGGEIVMPCCGAQGIAKQFASGTRFFAHKARSFTCDWKPESEEHLRYKAMAFDAAMAAGAIAETEVRSNPNGPAEWIADVLVTHKNIRRVIEIQLAPQSMAETLARTQRYSRAGMDVLWLFRRLPEGMKIGKDLPVIVLPEGDEEYAERVVRIAAAEFATGNLVWDEGLRVAPFTLVGYDILCSNCGERYHHTPTSILRCNEVDGRFGPRIVALEKLSVCGGGPWEQSWLKTPYAQPDPLGRRLGGFQSSCPHCRASGPTSVLTEAEVAQWPHGQLDGEANWDLRARWRPAAKPPKVYEPKADQAAWDALLQAKGLVIEPDREAAFFAERRRDYERRDRLRNEAEERERREIRERQLEKERRVTRLCNELRGTDTATAVQVTVDSDISYIRSITIRFRYDEKGKDALKAAGGKWDPDARTWTVVVGYGEFNTAEKVRDAVFEMRTRMDQRRR